MFTSVVPTLDSISRSNPATNSSRATTKISAITPNSAAVRPENTIVIHAATVTVVGRRSGSTAP